MKIYLTEDKRNSKIHIYVDDSTGDMYIFDGEKLIKLEKPDDTDESGNSKYSAPFDAEKEEAERQAQIDKEREESEDSDNEDESSNSGSSTDSEESDDENDSDSSSSNDDDDTSEDSGQSSTSSSKTDSNGSNNDSDEGDSDEGEDDFDDTSDESDNTNSNTNDRNSDETPEERKTRIDNIKRFLEDPDFEDTIIGETQAKVADSRKRKEARDKREREKNLKGAEKNNHVMSAFLKDLRNFIGREVGSRERVDTYRKYNGNYDGSGLVRKGHRYEENKKTPLIQIYLDQSGSWSNDELKLSNDIVKSLDIFERKKQIKTEVYYFANNIHTNPQAARNEGGTGAGTQLIQQLNDMKPDNVIIITDNDFDSWGLSGSYLASGGVWLIFRDARSKKLISAVKGKKMTKYYDIERTR